MKIGLDAKRLFNNFTGLGNHSRTTVDIVGSEFPDTSFYLYTPRVTSCKTTDRYMNRPDCHVVMPDGMMRGSVWRTLGIAAECRRDGIDVFHGLSNELPVGMHRYGIPTVVTIHDVAFKTFPLMYKWHDRMIYDLKWRYACRNADRIIAISQCTKLDVMRFYGVDEEKISVVYQPVNGLYYEELPSGTLAEEGKECTDYMLYVGSVNSRKNLLGVVKAISLLPADLRTKLIVVGDGGTYKREVMDYVVSHGLEPMVEWRRATDHTELRKLYSHALLFVYPSFYEGFGLPVVEAQLSGCPVVTSNVSSLPEAGGPYALKVDPNSPENIADKLSRLIADKALRNELALKGREYAMNTFHPAVLARQLMDVYRLSMEKKRK